MENPGCTDQERNWSETVEDLVASDNVDSAIIFLENVVSQLEKNETNDLALSSALEELAKLYLSKNISLKSDDLFSRSTLLKLRAVHLSIPPSESKGPLERAVVSPGKDTQCNDSVASEEEDDWEVIADRLPVEFNVPDNLPATSTALEVSNKVTRRRGRGTFSYKKDELYSDKIHGEAPPEEEDECCTRNPSNDDPKAAHCNTQHVIVLSDFPPSFKTIDIENTFADYQSCGIAIRWVDDTKALVVFQTPTLATEALQKISFPFKSCILDNDDPLLSRISAKDLEAPRARPKTSARTAQRMIAQAVGLKISDPNFGPAERRAQEESRRRRIVTRQKLIEDAWGSE